MDILVLHPGALGDIILSFPALGSLRARFPGARITLSCQVSGFRSIASGCADAALPLSALPLHRLFADDPLSDADIHFWRNYDRIVSWTGAACSEFEKRFRSVHSSVLIPAWKPRVGEKRHVSRIFMESLEPWVSAAEPAAPAIVPDRRDAREAEQWLTSKGFRCGQAVIALHPGAGGTLKRWPVQRFLELAQRLQKEQPLVIIEGPAELGLARTLAGFLPAEKAHVASSPSLGRLAALISLCRAYVGNDSGVAHLAAALGVPTVVLFGPTSPELWAPLGKRVFIVRPPEGCSRMSSISPETVLETILQGMGNLNLTDPKDRSDPTLPSTTASV